MRELLAGLFIIIIYLQALVSLLYDGHVNTRLLQGSPAGGIALASSTC